MKPKTAGSFSPIRIALTPGDPRGIGPEIVIKTLARRGEDLRRRGVEVIIVGAAAPFESMTQELNLLAAPGMAPGGALIEGWQAGWSIQTAASMVAQGHCDAMVTGPIHKERLQLGGWNFTGHTDFLADYFKVPEVTMMLANSTLRVSLVTVHTSLESVARKLTPEGIQRAIAQTAEGLSRYWGVKRPRIAVSALNPHAGEGGLFGREESKIITPAIELARKSLPTIEILGPFPADTLFARSVGMPAVEKPDAIVAMYHDQGLIPVKLVDFARTVNLTLGLPIVRTSVDHGTAFDIAGKGIADPSSLEAALDLAIHAVESSRAATA